MTLPGRTSVTVPVATNSEVATIWSSDSNMRDSLIWNPAPDDGIE